MHPPAATFLRFTIALHTKPPTVAATTTSAKIDWKVELMFYFSL